MSYRAFFAGTVLACLLVLPASAAPVLTILSNVSGVPCQAGLSWGFCGIFPEVWSTTGPVVAAGSANGTNSTLYATGRADWGSMGAIVRATSDADGWADGAVLVYMQDTWVVGGGTPGTSGTIDIQVTLDGSFEFVWSRNESFYIGIDWPGGVPNHLVDLTCRVDTGCNGISPFSGTGTLQKAITFGTPFDVVLALIASSGAQNGGHQSVDAWSTGRISGFTVRDAAGNIIPDFALTADSGHDYLAGLGGSAVPEPSAWSLLALGVALLAGKAIARK